MTDRELLEPAAKAAGIELQWIGEGRMASCFDPASEREWWNPINDDGDALRLSVKLRLEIEHNHRLEDELYVIAMRAPNEHMKPINAIEEFDDEVARHSATRRAIVRAAAEIGKAMP